MTYLVCVLIVYNHDTYHRKVFTWYCVRSIDVASFYYFPIKFKMLRSLVFFWSFILLLLVIKTKVTDYVLMNKVECRRRIQQDDRRNRTTSDTAITHTQDHSLSRLGTGTSIECGVVKLILWGQILIVIHILRFHPL